MIIDRLLLRKIKPLKRSVLLLGPRQTGKSTLLKELKPDLTINLSNEEEYFRLLSSPGELSERAKNKKVIFLDEVQRIPSLLNTVQFLIDEDPSLRFLLSGSSARKLRRGQANLLPGRVLTYQLGPLCIEELQKLPQLPDAPTLLKKGLLPGILLEQDESVWKKLLRSYAATYLKEEIQAEALTRNMQGFSRFFEVIASRSGAFLDLAKFASQAEIDRSSTRRYFEILQDTLVVNAVEPFSKSKTKRLVQHPKFFIFDVGVLNGCLRNFEISPDRIGNLFEHLVLQLILSSAKSRDLEPRLSTYRTERGAEVDFIVEIDGRVIAIEVKASKKIDDHDLRGFKSFKEFYKKPFEPMVIYLGRYELEKQGVAILPLMVGLEKIFSKSN